MVNVGEYTIHGIYHKNHRNSHVGFLYAFPHRIRGTRDDPQAKGLGLLGRYKAFDPGGGFFDR